MSASAPPRLESASRSASISTTALVIVIADHHKDTAPARSRTVEPHGPRGGPPASRTAPPRVDSLADQRVDREAAGGEREGRRHDRPFQAAVFAAQRVQVEL